LRGDQCRRVERALDGRRDENPADSPLLEAIKKIRGKTDNPLGAAVADFENASFASASRPACRLAGCGKTILAERCRKIDSSREAATQQRFAEEIT
jgi:hypothetical protein